MNVENNPEIGGGLDDNSEQPPQQPPPQQPPPQQPPPIQEQAMQSQENLPAPEVGSEMGGTGVVASEIGASEMGSDIGVDVGTDFEAEPSDFDAEVVSISETAPASSPTGVPPKTSRGEIKDIFLSMLTGLVGAGVFLLCYAGGKIALLALITIALAVATLELYKVLQKVGYHPATLLGLASTVGLTLGVYWRGVEVYPILLGLIVFFTFLWYLLVAPDKSAVPNIGVTLFGVFYIGVLGSVAALLLTYEDGTNLVLAATLAVASYDVGGWLIGKWIGRTRFTLVSPNKTLEGLMGGMLAAVLVPVVVLQSLELAPWGDDPGTLSDVLLLGIVAAVVAPLGDLFESLVKRNMNVKDMGTILPGHGGVLDRIDALLFVIPASYMLARLLDILELS